MLLCLVWQNSTRQIWKFLQMRLCNETGSHTAMNAFRKWINDFPLFFAFDSSLPPCQCKLKNRKQREAFWFGAENTCPRGLAVLFPSITAQQTVTTATWKQEKKKSSETRCVSHCGTRQQASQRAVNPVCTVTHWCTWCSIPKTSTLIVRCADEHLSPVRTENVKCFCRGRGSGCICGDGRVDPEV